MKNFQYRKGYILVLTALTPFWSQTANSIDIPIESGEEGEHVIQPIPGPRRDQAPETSNPSYDYAPESAPADLAPSASGEPSIEPSGSGSKETYTPLDKVTIEDQKEREQAAKAPAKAVAITGYEQICGECSKGGAVASALLQGGLLIAGLVGSGERKPLVPELGFLTRPPVLTLEWDRFADEITWGQPLQVSSLVNSAHSLAVKSSLASSSTLLSISALSSAIPGSSFASLHLSSLTSSILASSLQSSLSAQSALSSILSQGLSSFLLSGASLASVETLSASFAPLSASLSALPLSLSAPISAPLLSSAPLTLSLTSSVLTSALSSSGSVVLLPALLSSSLPTLSSASALIPSLSSVTLGTSAALSLAASLADIISASLNVTSLSSGLYSLLGSLPASLTAASGVTNLSIASLSSVGIATLSIPLTFSSSSLALVPSSASAGIFALAGVLSSLPLELLPLAPSSAASASVLAFSSAPLAVALTSSSLLSLPLMSSLLPSLGIGELAVSSALFASSSLLLSAVPLSVSSAIFSSILSIGGISLSLLGSSSLVPVSLWSTLAASSALSLSAGISALSIAPSSVSRLSSAVSSQILSVSFAASSLSNALLSLPSILSSAWFTSFIPALTSLGLSLSSSLIGLSAPVTSVSGSFLASSLSPLVASLASSTLLSGLSALGSWASVSIPSLSLPSSLAATSALLGSSTAISTSALALPPLAALSSGLPSLSEAANSSLAPSGVLSSLASLPLSSITDSLLASGLISSGSGAALTLLPVQSSQISSLLGSSIASLALSSGVPASFSLSAASPLLSSAVVASTLGTGIASLTGLGAYYSLLASAGLPSALLSLPGVATSTALFATAAIAAPIVGSATAALTAISSSGSFIFGPSAASSLAVTAFSVANPFSLFLLPITLPLAVTTGVTAITSALSLAFVPLGMAILLPLIPLTSSFLGSTGLSGVLTAWTVSTPSVAPSSSILAPSSLVGSALSSSALVPLISAAPSLASAFFSGSIPASLLSSASASSIPSVSGSSLLASESASSIAFLPLSSILAAPSASVLSLPLESSHVVSSSSIFPSLSLGLSGSLPSALGVASASGSSIPLAYSVASFDSFASAAVSSLSNTLLASSSSSVAVPAGSLASVLGASTSALSLSLPVSSSVGPISAGIGSTSFIPSALSLLPSLSTASTPMISAAPSLTGASGLGLTSSPSAAESSFLTPVLASSLGAGFSKLSGPHRDINWKYGFFPYNYEHHKEGFEFRNLVVLGDSLSDSGSYGRGSVYMADGNPYLLYDSYLSLALSGKPIKPANRGGANYAISGAVLRSNVLDPISWLIPRDSLKGQVNRYLAKNGGKANKDDIFVLWGGGNDVTGDIQYALLNPMNWKTILKGAAPHQPYLNDKALFPGILAQKLINKGAEGPILVMNLPSSAYTPFTGVLAEATVDTGMITGGTPFDLFNVGGWLLKAQDSFLRNPANRVGSLSQGHGLAYLRENNINAIHARYPFLPRAWVETYFDTVFKAQNNIINWFNGAESDRLAQVKGGNIVQLDINQLYGEVLEDPNRYGIDEILVPECEIGQVAPNCDAGDSYYHGGDGKRYMYTDWHHPSAWMHRIIAEYAMATLNAPAYVAGLSRALEIGAQARQDYLLGELTRINARPYEGQGQTYVFGGFSGGYSKQKKALNNHEIVYNGLNIGYGYRPQQGVDIGMMASLGLSAAKPNRNFKSDQGDLGLNVFGQYSQGPWWVSGILSAAVTRFSDIERSVPLGDFTRVEKGETNGTTFGGRVETGYEFNLGNSWILAPFAAYTNYRYTVSGYQEEGSSSTAMQFAKQKHHQEYVSAGLRLSDDCGDDAASLRGSVDLTINRVLNQDKNRLSGEGGLKEYHTQFKRVPDGLVSHPKNWVEIKPTLQYKLSKKARITTAVSYSIDSNKAKNKDLSYSIGYRYEL